MLATDDSTACRDRQRPAAQSTLDGGSNGVAGTSGFGPHAEAFTLVIDVDLLEGIEVSDHVRPLEGLAGGVKPLEQCLAQGEHNGGRFRALLL